MEEGAMAGRSRMNGNGIEFQGRRQRDRGSRHFDPKGKSPAHGVLGYEAMGLNRFLAILSIGVHNYEATRASVKISFLSLQDGRILV